MNFISHSAPRIKEERRRLRLTQAQAADKCEVSREIWGKYERGISTPGGEVLLAFAQAGADMNYILTGQRTKEILDTREKALIDNYRNSEERGKKIIEQTAFATAQPEEIETEEERRKKA